MPVATLEQVLEHLDPEQHAVATAPRGPVCVLAGAGTGKTRALTHRIAALVLSGQVDPRHVLALTFTARAAGELRARLRTLGVEGAQARTFHAAALRQLRFFWPSVVGGAPPEVVGKKAPLVAEAASRLRVRPDATLVRDLSAEIEWAKVSAITPDSYAERAGAAGRDAAGALDHATVGRIYAGYESVKTGRGVIDFEDVLLLTAGMVADDQAMSGAVRDQYRCLFVDEYQDVSPIQQRLLDLWLAGRDDLTVVGDPNQTIYSFAGATSEYLRGFAARYPDATVLQLVRSYRSTPEVVDAANRLLASASDGPRQVVLRAQRASGPPLQWVTAADEAAEVAAVVGRIAELIDHGVRPTDIAVLYRINAQSAAYEEGLTEAGIRYTVRGGERFFDRREVRDALTLLRGASRAADESTTGEGLPEHVTAVLSTIGYGSTPPPGPSQARDRWESWAALVAVARELAAAHPQAGLADLVDELQHRAATQHVPSGDGVTLASMHSAKGLEWDTVFLVGLTDGMVPITYATTPDQVAEERRLLYVGMTRAATRLVLSYARARNAGDRRIRQPSPFLGAFMPGFGANEPASPPRTRGGRGPATCRRCHRALTTAAERKLRHCTGCEAEVDLVLFESLRVWRKAVADAASVPAFVVFTDATLTVVAVEHPTTDAELRRIPGIGAVKAERYGSGLLDVVRKHASPPANTTRD